jgi:hypothetical protein
MTPIPCNKNCLGVGQVVDGLSLFLWIYAPTFPPVLRMETSMNNLHGHSHLWLPDHFSQWEKNVDYERVEKRGSLSVTLQVVRGCNCSQQATTSEVSLIGLVMSQLDILVPRNPGQAFVNSHHSTPCHNTLDCDVCFLLVPSGY